ncbi:MAG: hypothetical protein ACE5FA_06600 [Dehalococcoidia bacterium]
MRVRKQEAETVKAMEQLEREIHASSEPVAYELLGDAPAFVMPAAPSWPDASMDESALLRQLRIMEAYRPCWWCRFWAWLRRK